MSLLLFAALALSSSPGAPSPMRGMTVSCAGWGDVWGSETMRQALSEIRELGVTWVSIHPYGQIERDGSVRTREDSSGPPPEYLVRAGEYARAEKLKLFSIPHIAYWGRYNWRGDIQFAQEAQWARFFRDYRTFIVSEARTAQAIGAELFSVGVELDATTHRPEWKEIIAAVRRAYHGPITYAANWDRYAATPFWRELDLIGVQAYFPLSAENPRDSWAVHVDALEKLSKAVGKPVVFTEIGYNRSSEAAAQPWLEKTSDSPQARVLRSKLMMEALGVLDRRSDLIRGAFWWKWIPETAPWENDFRMRDDEARSALRATWGRDTRGSSTPTRR